MTRVWRTALFLGTALGIAPAAHAQAQAQGQVPTREEVNPPAPDRSARPSSVSVDSSGAFARGPCPLENSDLRTTIPAVQFGAIGGAPLLGLAILVLSILVITPIYLRAILLQDLGASFSTAFVLDFIRRHMPSG